MVKYAHYRVFFTMDGLTDESSYDDIKKQHIKFVEDHTDAKVLFYKLYKDQKKGYLGCGDLTIDTKESLDKLLSQDQHKEYDLGNGHSGVFYRYNRKGKSPSHSGGKQNVESA